MFAPVEIGFCRWPEVTDRVGRAVVYRGGVFFRSCEPIELWWQRPNIAIGNRRAEFATRLNVRITICSCHQSAGCCKISLPRFDALILQILHELTARDRKVMPVARGEGGQGICIGLAHTPLA